MIDIDVTRRMQTQEGAIDLSVRTRILSGELVTLSGPSGAGKTTLLRAIAGLTKPDRGRIAADNSVWFDSRANVNVRPERRNLGFVFQEDALFPHLTVRQNVLFAHRCERTARDWLVFLELDHLASRYPRQLSGGQRQRVAIARALARRPGLLLLDEPFSHLDGEMRDKLSDEVRRINVSLAVTVIFVTHDAEEIRRLDGRRLILDQGRLAVDRNRSLLTGLGPSLCRWGTPVSPHQLIHGSEGALCKN